MFRRYGPSDRLLVERCQHDYIDVPAVRRGRNPSARSQVEPGKLPPAGEIVPRVDGDDGALILTAVQIVPGRLDECRPGPGPERPRQRVEDLGRDDRQEAESGEGECLADVPWRFGADSMQRVTYPGERIVDLLADGGEGPCPAFTVL